MPSPVLDTSVNLSNWRSSFLEEPVLQLPFAGHVDNNQMEEGRLSPSQRDQHGKMPEV
jgi:hypothetical protein